MSGRIQQMPHPLRIADLRAATARLLDAAERQFGPEIDLDALPVGYYWELDSREAFDVGNVPSPAVMGDVSEDLEETKQLLNRPVEETYLWHDLRHLIGLLRLLAYLDLPKSDTES